MKLKLPLVQWSTETKIILVALGFISNFIMAEDNLKIYLGDLDNSPSHFHSPGGIHSSFNAAVRGQLLISNESFKLRPGIIEHFEFDYATKEYILKLRPNLKFHNGRAVTSEDLEFSLLRGFYSARSNFFRSRFGNIKGVSKIKKGSKYKPWSVEGIRKLDKLSIGVSLDVPNPSFLHNLTSPYYSLIPKEELEEDYLTWRSVPVGVGDFKVVSEDLNKKLTVLERVINNGSLHRLELHWGKTPPDNTGLSFVEIEGFKVNLSNLPISVRIIEFSTINELSKYPEFRRAIDILIDRDRLNNQSFGVSPLNQVLPKHFWGRIDEVQSQSSKIKAMELLDKIPLKLREKEYDVIVYTGGKMLSPLHMFYKRELTKQFRDVGLNFNFVPNSSKFFSKEVCEKSPFVLSGKIVDYVDPLIMFASYRKDGHDEFLRAPQESIDRYHSLYLKASKADSLENRLNTVAKLNKFTKENVVVSSLAEERSIYYINKSKVSSIGNQPSPMTLLFSKIVLK